MAATTTDWVGQKISDGRYEISKHLGEGGMGFVYLAHDSRLETDVVIKVPHRELMADPDVARRFMRETRSLIKLTHPSIVKIHDVGEHDDLPYFVMQYFPGGDLSARFEQLQKSGEYASCAQVTQWLRPIAEALDHIHSQGYVHRDIKPANILFDEHGHPYLSDFGIIKALEAEQSQTTSHLTRTGMAIGTPDYMAPEIIMGNECDGRADQYSLALIAFESVCGRLPFEGPTVGAVMVQHAQMEPPSPVGLNSSLPKGLSDAILKGLAKNPSDRHDSSALFISCLGDKDFNREQANPVQASAPSPTTASKETHGIQSPASDTVIQKKTQCPECGQKFSVFSQQAGKKGRCPKCKALLTIDKELTATVQIANLGASQGASNATSSTTPRQKNSDPASKPTQTPNAPPEASPQEETVAPTNKSRRVFVSVAVACSILFIAGAIIVPKARQNAARNINKNHIKIVTLSVHNFESSYGQLPHDIYNSRGTKPLLSWRVRLLPFIEEELLYDQFRLHEPWDSSHNQSLVEKMPEVYSAAGSTSKPGRTRFLALSGIDHSFASNQRTTFRDITDGTANTIMFVLSNEEDRIWSKPTDIRFNSSNPLDGIIGGETGFLAGFYDTSVRWINRADYSSSELKKLFEVQESPANDDPFGGDDLFGNLDRSPTVKNPLILSYAKSPVRPF